MTPLPRSQFPVTRHHRFFNHAGVTPLPVVAAEAISRCTDAFVTGGSVALDPVEARQEEIRVIAAQLLGVPDHTVAFVKNTTEGLSFVANGLRWSPGDRVVLPACEFPSNAYPWLALRDLGVQVDFVEPVGPGQALPVEQFEQALRAAPTRLVATSWVQFGRGWRTDLAGLASLCHEHGALLCVDVIQGLGLLPADLAAWGVDFAAADAHKWMLGPLGVGLFYVAEEHIDLLRPMEPGWASVQHRDDYDRLELAFDPTARRFEGGSFNNITIEGMGASIELLLEAGVDAVWRHVDELDRRLTEGLTAIGVEVLSDRSGDGRSGIVAFAAPGGDPAESAAALQADGFVTAARSGAVRVSPHGYNTADEIDELVAAVERLARAAR